MQAGISACEPQAVLTSIGDCVPKLRVTGIPVGDKGTLAAGTIIQDFNEPEVEYLVNRDIDFVLNVEQMDWNYTLSWSLSVRNQYEVQTQTDDCQEDPETRTKCYTDNGVSYSHELNMNSTVCDVYQAVHGVPSGSLTSSLPDGADILSYDGSPFPMQQNYFVGCDDGLDIMLPLPVVGPGVNQLGMEWPYFSLYHDLRPHPAPLGYFTAIDSDDPYDQLAAFRHNQELFPSSWGCVPDLLSDSMLCTWAVVQNNHVTATAEFDATVLDISPLLAVPFLSQHGLLQVPWSTGDELVLTAAVENIGDKDGAFRATLRDCCAVPVDGWQCQSPVVERASPTERMVFVHGGAVTWSWKLSLKDIRTMNGQCRVDVQHLGVAFVYDAVVPWPAALPPSALPTPAPPRPTDAPTSFPTSPPTSLPTTAVASTAPTPPNVIVTDAPTAGVTAASTAGATEGPTPVTTQIPATVVASTEPTSTPPSAIVTDAPTAGATAAPTRVTEPTSSATPPCAYIDGSGLCTDDVPSATPALDNTAENKDSEGAHAGCGVAVVVALGAALLNA